MSDFKDRVQQVTEAAESLRDLLGDNADDIWVQAQSVAQLFNRLASDLADAINDEELYSERNRRGKNAVLPGIYRENPSLAVIEFQGERVHLLRIEGDARLADDGPRADDG